MPGDPARCPAGEQIQALLSGGLSDEDARRVIERLAGDAALEAHGPGPSDTLMRILRSLASRPLEPDAPELAEVLQQVLARTTTGQAATATPQPVDPGSAYPYLSPPGGPNELGRLGEYRILRVLGEGGMGTVFVAEDPRLGRAVALKTLRRDLLDRPDARERFLREARAVAAVDHEHVIPIFAVAEQEGVPFLIMPLLQGETLEDRLAATGSPLPVAQVLALGEQAARGLAAAHQRGVIHRDVKPGNVFLARSADGRGEEVRLLDFGLARGAAGDVALTQSGAVLGTPSYMAPEQADGEVVDARADLFSLGCVLYHMTTGRRPFTGPNSLAVLRQVGRVSPPAPHTLNPEVPAALSRLILRLLEKDRERRPGSADEVAVELRRIAASTSEPPRRRRLAVGMLGAAALAALAGVIIIKSRTPDGRLLEIHVPSDHRIVLGDKGEVTVSPPPVRPPGDATQMRPPSAGLPSAAEPVRDFVACAALGGEQLDAWLKKDAEGFRLRWLDVQLLGGQTRFAAIAVKSRIRRLHEVRHRVPDEDHAAITRDWEETTRRGFRPVWDWRYRDGGGIYRTRLWTKDGQGFILVHSAPGEIVKHANRVINDGFTLSAILPCALPDRTEYILTTDSNRRAMSFSLDAGRDELREYCRQIEAKGWSLDQLTAYRQGGVERFIVVASENVGKPARTVEWDVAPGKMAERVVRQKQKGLMPWCLTAYGAQADTA